MNLKETEELFNALNDTGIKLGFGWDACSNIPNRGDPDDTGWHLMLHDKGLFDGGEDAFNRVLEERGLEWKYEEFLGWSHISIYRPDYRFPGRKSNMVKT